MMRRAAYLLAGVLISSAMQASADTRLSPCQDCARSAQERATICRALAEDAALDATARGQAQAGLAEALLALGDWNTLLAIADERLRADVNDRLGHGMRGLAYLNRGQPGDAERARDAYDEAHRRFPLAFLFVNNRGVAKAMLGDIDGALADHGRALELQPGFLPALTGRSQLLNDRKDYTAALADAERGLNGAPDNVPLLGEMARALLGLNRDREAIPVLDRAIALAPTRTMLHFRRGLVRAESGDIDGAIADFTHVIANNPSAPGAYVQRGRLLLNIRKDAAAAASDLDRAIAVGPAFAMGWSQRALLKMSRGDAAGAEADARKALSLDAVDPVAKIALSAVLDARGDLAGALRLVTEAVASQPDVVEARIEQIDLLMRLGRHRDAFDSASEGLRRAPAKLDLIDRRAAAQIRLARVAEAKTDLDSAIAQGHRRASTHAIRAGLALVLKDFALMERDVASALALDPAHRKANALAGLLALRSKDWRKAEATAARVLAAEPDNGLALAVSAEALRRTGRTAEADRALAKLRGKDPRFAEMVKLMMAQ
jgi:tetratricopeptide (TPR) repeat protein